MQSDLTDCDQEDYQLVVNGFLKVMSTGEAGPPGYWCDAVWEFNIMTLQETLRLAGMGVSPQEAVTEALCYTPRSLRPDAYKDPAADMRRQLEIDVAQAIATAQGKERGGTDSRQNNDEP